MDFFTFWYKCVNATESDKKGDHKGPLVATLITLATGIFGLIFGSFHGFNGTNWWEWLLNSDTNLDSTFLSKKGARKSS